MTVLLLEIISLDFVHGFNVLTPKLRAELPPGQITRVRFTPERRGLSLRLRQFLWRGA